uniref:tRNA-yW synthesizing protein 5 n=1 Tax=Suricata suricatta TaxID=37032 RepID=A0A673T3M3_SURSU
MAWQSIPVPRLEGVSQEQFTQQLYPQRKPLVLEGIDLGACTSKWTVDYLSQVGGEKAVKVHVAAVAQMDFIKLYLLISWFRGQLKKSMKSSLSQRQERTVDLESMTLMVHAFEPHIRLHAAPKPAWDSLSAPHPFTFCLSK